METDMLVQHSIRSVAKGDVDELQDGRRQLPHVCEVELHRVLPRDRLCQAAPHLHSRNRSAQLHSAAFCGAGCCVLQ